MTRPHRLPPVLLASCLALAASAAFAQTPTPHPRTPTAPVAPPDTAADATTTGALGTVPAALPPLADEGTFTLQQALDVMNRTNPLIAAGRAADHAAGRDVVSAGLWTNPIFSLQWTHTMTINSAIDPVAGYFQAGLQQQVEVAGVPGARRRVAEHNYQATQGDTEMARRGLMFDLYTSYVALAGAARRRDVYREAIAQMIRVAEVVRRRVAAGAVPDYDLRRIMIALANAQAALDDAEADLIAARGDLDATVGPGAAQLRGLPDFDPLDQPPLQPLPALLDAMYRGRPDLMAARQRAQAADEQVSVARRSVFNAITVNAGLAVGANNPWANCQGLTAMQPGAPNTVPQQSPMGTHTCGDQGTLGPEIDFTVGFTLPLPLLDRGQGTIPAAQWRAANARLTADAVRLAAESRVMSSYREYARRRQLLQSFQNNPSVNSLPVMQQEAENSYVAGRTNILNLVNAYNTVRDTRLQLGQLAQDTHTAEIHLWHFVGVLPQAGSLGTHNPGE